MHTYTYNLNINILTKERWRRQSVIVDQLITKICWIILFLLLIAVLWHAFCLKKTIIRNRNSFKLIQRNGMTMVAVLEVISNFLLRKMAKSSICSIHSHSICKHIWLNVYIYLNLYRLAINFMLLNIHRAHTIIMFDP